MFDYFHVRVLAIFSPSSFTLCEGTPQNRTKEGNKSQFESQAACKTRCFYSLSYLIFEKAFINRRNNSHLFHLEWSTMKADNL